MNKTTNDRLLEKTVMQNYKNTTLASIHYIHSNCKVSRMFNFLSAPFVEIFWGYRNYILPTKMGVVPIIVEEFCL